MEQAREWLTSIRQIDLNEHEKEGGSIIRSLLAELEEVTADAEYLGESWYLSGFHGGDCTCPACETARKYKR